MRKPFLDPAHNDFFGDQGYLLLPGVFGPPETDALRMSNISDYIAFRDKYFTSLDTPDVDLKEQAVRIIREVVTPKASGWLDRYRPVISSFVVKMANSRQPLKMHQNPTFVDERFYTSMVCWVPLVDVSASNGAMIVVPGSHRLLPTFRMANFLEEDLFDPISKEILKEYGKTLPMQAGDVLFLDDALLHASHGNQTAADRVAVAQVLIPEESDLLYCHRAQGLNSLYRVEDEFYERLSSLADAELNDLIGKLVPMKTFRHVRQKLTFADFEKLIRFSQKK